MVTRKTNLERPLLATIIYIYIYVLGKKIVGIGNSTLCDDAEQKFDRDEMTARVCLGTRHWRINVQQPYRWPNL